MSGFEIGPYSALIEQCAAAGTSQEKGSALEDLLRYLLDSVPGVSVRKVRVQTQAEEIDIVAFNERRDRAFADWDPIIFVECKNWRERVGKDEVVVFLDKLRGAGLHFGILVAREGVTGDANGRRDATLKLREAMRDGFRVIVVTLAELEVITDAASFSNLVIDKFCDSFVGRWW